MLDAVDSDRDRLLYGRCYMRMCSHRHTGRVSPVNDQLKPTGGELGKHHIGAGSVDTARGHHLDDVRAPFHPFRDGCAARRSVISPGVAGRDSKGGSWV